MMRMIKMELVVFRSYLKQMLFSTLFMAACFAAGVGSIMPLPGMIFMMGMFSITTSASNYDEHNGWAAFRLAMPLSRRDIVLGRYAFVLLGAFAFSLVVTAIALSLTGLSSVVSLPPMIADIVYLDSEVAGMSAFTFLFCGAMGFVIASVSLPMFFRFGQTKATQWLPFIMMFLGVAPFVLVGFLGEEAMAAAQQAFAFVETPEGLAAFAVGALAFVAACYAASAFISVKLYEARDL